MKKITILLIIGLLIGFVLTGCNGIVPGEGEGEGEPETENMTVLMEAFIAMGCSACSKVEPILEQLAGEYSRDKLILVELVPWGNLYNLNKSYQRMLWYGLQTKIPQITFNGLNNNILGVTDYSTIKNNIEKQLSITPTIKLEASRTTTNAGTVIQGKVKNISNYTLTNLLVSGMLIKDMGQAGFHYVVTDIFGDESQIINSLTAGEEKNFTITLTETTWGSKNDGVIFVQSVADAKKTIRQSLFID